MSVDGIGPGVAHMIQTFNEWDKVDRIIDYTRETGAGIITYYDEAYPRLLREIYDPPVLLWIKGSAEILNNHGLAIVGTRSATNYGLSMAEKLAGELVKEGLTIVSGLAHGVDAAAHKGTLNADGKTVAVLGSGIDVVYPWKNRGLARDIEESGGAVITEFIPETKPETGNFPMRNRIVSGMTLGTLVVESGLKGGSMITARSAVDQNREVFVVPHSLENVNGIGCNAIIKRGWGKLIQSVGDILSEIPVIRSTSKDTEKHQKIRWKELDLDEFSLSICKKLEDNPLHIDDLSEQLDAAPHELLPKLLELEMKNCIRQTAGKNFELR